jgi:hypothetical protein
MVIAAVKALLGIWVGPDWLWSQSDNKVALVEDGRRQVVDSPSSWA